MAVVIGALVPCYIALLIGYLIVVGEDAPSSPPVEVRYWAKLGLGALLSMMVIIHCAWQWQVGDYDVVFIHFAIILLLLGVLDSFETLWQRSRQL